MKKRFYHKTASKKKNNNARSLIKKIGITLSAAALLAMATPQTGDAATAAYVNVKGANVRQKPVEGENITSLPYGTYLQVYETQQGSDGLSWSKVEFSNQGKSVVGWVRSDLIISAKDADAQRQKEAAEKKTEAQQETQQGNADGKASTENGDTTQKETAETKKKDTEENQDDTEHDTSEDAAQGSTAENSVLQEDGTIVIGSLTLEIQEKFTAEDIPIDFSADDITFQGKTYKGISYDNGDLKALYLVDKEKNVGTFYICDDKTASIYPFVRVTYGSGYLILLQNDDASELPEGSEETIIALDNGTQLKAFWHLGEEQTSDFYEVYTMNEVGECGWYSYDKVDKTCQRLNIQDNSAKMKNLNDSYNKLKKQSEEQRKGFHKIIAGIGLLVILLLFACLNSMLKVPAKKKKKTSQPYREKPAKKQHLDAEEVKRVIAAEVEEEKRAANKKEENVSAKDTEEKVSEDTSVRDRYMAALEKVSQSEEEKENPPKAAFIQKAKDVQEGSQREIKERLNAVGKEGTDVEKKASLEHTKKKSAGARKNKSAVQKKEKKTESTPKQDNNAKKAAQRAEQLVAAQAEEHHGYARTKDVYSGKDKGTILHEDITKNSVERSDEDELEIMDLTNL